MAYREGQWEKRPYRVGTDSALFPRNRNNNNRYQNISDLKLGTVMVPQPEPVYKESSVSISLVSGGTLTNVAWPGPQVDMNPSGIIAGGVAVGIHGLWQAPLNGQQVLVGFVEGSSQNPIVLEKYSYNASPRVDLEFNHILPLSSKLIGPTDVVLGHHIGSFIAFRGTLPVPGEIDIFALTIFTLTTLGAVAVTVGGVWTENITGAKTVTVGGAVAIVAGGIMSLTSGGLVSVIGVPGMNINAGIFPAAAVGDLVATIFGLSPVVAGPGRVPAGLTIT
jgi:hypothetical protein